MILKKNDLYKAKLDEEEQNLLESVERGEWTPVDNPEEEALIAKQASTNYLRKEARVNIRLSRGDLTLLKQKAAYKGLPYQTLMSSVLHEYAAGHFKE